jgi:dTDP-4-dehydrorhamnose 3,5-epimerase
MRVKDTSLPDVKLFEPRVFGDHRGFFMETWNRRTFRQAGYDLDFVQDNHSTSVQGVLRGLHYQVRQPQGKLVRVIRGDVFDVAVDIRPDSPTFGQWTGIRLSAENHRLMWVPPGFAHGFYVLSGEAEFVYKCTDYYLPDAERTIRWDDPELDIDWPLVDGVEPAVSEKDAAGAWLREAEL